MSTDVSHYKKKKKKKSKRPNEDANNKRMPLYNDLVWADFDLSAPDLKLPGWLVLVVLVEKNAPSALSAFET